MYAEELKQKPIGTVAGIFITLGIVAAVMACVIFVGALQVWLGVYWLQFILYAAAIVAAVFIVRNMLTEYIYLIEKDRITFGRRIGKREKELLFIPFREIVAFGPYAQLERQIQDKKRHRYTFRKKADWYVIDCAGCAVILTPTQQYIDCLAEVKSGKKAQNDG